MFISYNIFKSKLIIIGLLFNYNKIYFTYILISIRENIIIWKFNKNNIINVLFNLGSKYTISY